MKKQKLNIPYSVEDFCYEEWTDEDIENGTEPKLMYQTSRPWKHDITRYHTVWEYKGKYYSVDYGKSYDDCYDDSFDDIHEVFKHVEVKEVVTFTTTP